MRFLVASTRHHLLPLHHRLRREKQDTSAVTWRSRYERAWDGSISRLARHSDGSLHAGALKEQVEQAQAGALVVVTDVKRVAQLFERAPRLYAALGVLTPEPPKDHLCVGGWFTGEEIQAPHLLVMDHGAWGGGMGPEQLGGLTLVRMASPEVPPFLSGAVGVAARLLKEAGFKGLFHFDVEEASDTGEFTLRGLSAGWPWLHTQAFLAELGSLSRLLEGAPPELKRRFVTVLPVSVPPWPNEKTQALEAGVPIEGLTAKQQGSLFWFDIQVRDRRLCTAGLDGLLAVAVGSADATPALARARALELATRLQVPGLQYRPDVGAQVDGALATLEDRLGFVAI